MVQKSCGTDDRSRADPRVRKAPVSSSSSRANSLLLGTYAAHDIMMITCPGGRWADSPLRHAGPELGERMPSVAIVSRGLEPHVLLLIASSSAEESTHLLRLYLLDLLAGQVAAKRSFASPREREREQKS